MAGTVAMVGANIAGSLAESVLGSRDPERIKRLILFLRSRLGRGGISPERQTALGEQIFRGGAPGRQRFAEGVSKRLGLESGFAQRAIGERLGSERLKIGTDIALQGERQGFQSDQQILATIAQLEKAIL